MKFHLWQQFTLFGRRWYWHLKARNGEIVAQSEAYRNRADALKTIELIRTKAADAAIEVVEP